MSAGPAERAPRDEPAHEAGDGRGTRAPSPRSGPHNALSGLRAPDPAAPYWREADGTRHSYGSLRCMFDERVAAELGEPHLAAIRAVAAAALAASERGNRRETARLATAAARLCGEIRGLWPASAVEVRRK
jgi:hypothetical protein